MQVNGVPFGAVAPKVGHPLAHIPARAVLSEELGDDVTALALTSRALNPQHVRLASDIVEGEICSGHGFRYSSFGVELKGWAGVSRDGECLLLGAGTLTPVAGAFAYTTWAGVSRDGECLLLGAGTLTPVAGAFAYTTSFPNVDLIALRSTLGTHGNYLLSYASQHL